MKKLITILFGCFLIIACKQENSSKAKDVQTAKEESQKTSNYPKALHNVFEAHGGMEAWKTAKSLTYEIENTEKNEKHITNLHSRKIRIEGNKFTIGFDGKDVWLNQKDTTAFRSNARFYHNLYFYFYAMPFVLGDDGITYKETEPISFEGLEYPGVEISYNDGVGDSPEDNYYIYYDPQNFQMAWLGYTVTYFDGKPSSKIGYINYNDWNKVGDVLLPKTITWYKTEEGKITEARNSKSFVNASISKEKPNETLFQKPEEGIVVEK